MEARELRIGNLVNFTTVLGTHNGGDITKILSDSVSFKTVTVPIENIKPIPITEEWLLKFGFEVINHSGQESHEYKKRYVYVNDKFGIHYCLRNNKPYFIRFNEFRPSFLIDEIHKCFPVNVHQLQNIVFTLTGEELQAK